MAKAPQFIGDWRRAGKLLRKSILKIIIKEPKPKLARTETFVVLLQYNP